MQAACPDFLLASFFGNKINSKYDGLYAGAEDVQYALKIYNTDVCITMHQQQKITLDDLLYVE